MTSLHARVVQLEARTCDLERRLRRWRLLAAGLVAGGLFLVGSESGGRFAGHARADGEAKPAAPPGEGVPDGATPREIAWQKLRGKLTLVQDTTRPEPGGGRHGEALAVVTDGRGIPFCFYERAPDGSVFKNPSTFIGNGGDINTSKWVIISNVHPPEGENYYCIPPSNDPCMLGVWQDVENCIQTRGPSKQEAFTVIRDEDGTYGLSIGNDGTLRWGSGTAVSKWPDGPGNRKVRDFLPDFLRYNPAARCLETNMEIRKVDR